ncbi:hypothetical protein SMI01S_21430 [Sphingobacterium mizutaii NBRC 14946 = DSM 11724]|uniref:Uncharacterized protein n=2 Tax=Sphingobacterium mizutaii TaxID=1010 RepID=A0AAJ4XBB5_9SPHI|nr:hypothetical protein [Sphingobacterium mizutaii]GEM68537.1 hypothetical protein SMI01S_21430 [Sphingobacterium mizutaii NBRC 14946 = DSM 11724]SDK88643.1 hypothetical protein SAMN05192578_101138 [Sphingobacterium mizutaii]SNV46600.1 Uncharacterised protein [Sphingobacterium mizutaii]
MIKKATQNGLLFLNQDGKDRRIDQDYELNQDGKDRRIDQDYELNQDGKDGRIDQDIHFKKKIALSILNEL